MTRLKRGIEGAPKDVIDQFKAFKHLFSAEIKEKLPEEEQKSMISINKAVKEAYDNITKEQEKEMTKLIHADKKRYEKERTEFNEKGFYTLKDGTRSIDQDKKKSKSKRREASSEKSDTETKGSVKKQGPKKMGRPAGKD